MTKGKDSHSEMAHARQSDGINVIFDQNSPTSSRSRSRSSGGSSRHSGSGRRGRVSHKGRYRSSSSSSRSSSRSRSRSHPRCHRRSSRCRCDNHRRDGGGRYRAHSRSHRRYSPDSRSSNRMSRHRRPVGRFTSRVSRSPSRTYRSCSRSRSSGRSISLSLDGKRELLKAAKTNAMKTVGVEKQELPESVKPILSEQSVESKQLSPETMVRQDPEKTLSQSSDVDSDDMSSPTMSPKRKVISFSINNSVVKPTAAAPSCPKVTPRVDSYESRKPYGHWVPVKSGQTSNRRKHTLAKSH
ncbi:arginine/serine-rich protein 1 [Enoplosus armatus]|uniref:arginine/serine-rich protein 1 n=1 Tax=Enoplosus armatus TaxID=215367 RepID=UPI003995F8D0